MTATENLIERKARCRREAGERRRAILAAIDATAAAEAAAHHLLDHVALPPGRPVSGFWPLEGEFDTRPLLTALHERGHPIGLPIVLGKARPLIFRRWHPGQVLVPGAFKVLTPPEDAPLLVPQILLVPLLAFDRAGYRMGYGGGFYDRTLAERRAADPETRAIGLAFAGQEIEAVPHEPTDQPLDWIVTEREARRCG